MKINELREAKLRTNKNQGQCKQRKMMLLQFNIKSVIRFGLSFFVLILLIPALASAQTDTTGKTNGKPVGLSNPIKTGKQSNRKKPGRKEAQSAAFVPQNYFYASVKLPVEELATYILTEEAELLDYENQNGLMLDFGYGKQVNKYFTMEGGIEAYLSNSLNLLYEHEQDEGVDELRIINSAYAIQLKPILTIPLDQEVSLRIGSALNYQLLRSAGKYYSYTDRAGEEVLSGVIKNTHRSRFLWNVTPFVGADFKLSARWGLGFDVSYVRYNWDKSISGLRFSSQPGLQIPEHKTSEVFLSIRATFR